MVFAPLERDLFCRLVLQTFTPSEVDEHLAPMESFFFLFRVFSVLSVYSVVILTPRTTEYTESNGITRNKNRPFFKVNHH